MKYKVEICVDTVESALEAQLAGADRVELCDNLIEGGTTPGPGTIQSARANLGIGLNVIIRPRGGDFLYSPIEFDIMKRDIDFCGEAGADGVVTGILRADGRVDIERTGALIEYARPMQVTFHRAFDMTPDPFAALEDIIMAGAERILTSGQKNSAAEGAALLKELLIKAGNRIIIMPGSGIGPANIESLARSTGAHEFHFSGRKTIGSGMIYRKESISMGGDSSVPEYGRKVADYTTIRAVIELLGRLGV